MKSIVFAEKPSVAKDLARVLGCPNKQHGFFEGKRYLVTWALGHLVTLADPEYYDKKLQSWRLEDLPMIPKQMKLRVIAKKRQQFQIVQKLMQRGDVVDLIIATDAGREGELVARWVMKLSGWKKPYHRLWISSQTDAAIREGFANLKPGSRFDNLYKAAVCRSEADWLIGLNVTRALTCKFNAQLNAGRVQTPTLAMVIEREQQIQSFTPVNFWTVRVDFGDYFGTWRNRDGNSRIFSASQAQELAACIEGKSGRIRDSRVENKNEPPPLAYDLTELQRDANRRYGFSAKKTLGHAQSLYDRHKLITYPRTDSRYITGDIIPTLPRRLEAMAGEPRYQRFIQPLLAKPINPGKRFVNDGKVSDHHAIIPTEQALDLAALDHDEKKIYDLIAKRFLVVLSPPYRYQRITVVTQVDDHCFYSQGRNMLHPGWREISSQLVEPETAPADDLPEQILSEQQPGASKPVTGVKIGKGKTAPPSSYTEATLLSAMEDAGKFIDDEELRESIKQGGLGTPATRAEIIEKLVYNHYLERHGKHLLPTSKARQLIKLVPQQLRSPELTARWELRLSNIAKGQESEQKFMEDIRSNARELVKVVREDTASYTPENVSKSKCPICGEFMLQINTKRGKTLACPDRSCGHRQPEKPEDPLLRKSSRGERARNQKLIAKYSDHAQAGTNVGELLKAALKQKKQENE